MWVCVVSLKSYVQTSGRSSGRRTHRQGTHTRPLAGRRGGSAAAAAGRMPSGFTAAAAAAAAATTAAPSDPGAAPIPAAAAAAVGPAPSAASLGPRIIDAATAAAGAAAPAGGGLGPSASSIPRPQSGEKQAPLGPVWWYSSERGVSAKGKRRDRAAAAKKPPSIVYGIMAASSIAMSDTARSN